MTRRRAVWTVALYVLLGAGLVALLMWATGGGEDEIDDLAEPSPSPTADPTPSPAPDEQPPEDPEPDEPPPDQEPPQEPPQQTEDGFGVVRSLAHDGQRLWVAAATGVWSIGAEGGAQPVEGPPTDLFSIAVGPDGALVGSGVGPEGDSGRLPLGVLRSTDEGRTWESLALDGESVLGALGHTDGVWYGYDFARRRLLASSDLRDWETRWEGPLFDVTIHPTDPDILMASFPEGDTGLEELRSSRDGGRTWDPVQAPALLLLEWSAADRLWAFTTDGAVFSSRDAGVSWSPGGGSVGTVTAVTEHEGALYVALRGHGIHRSEDEGRTWDRLDQ